MNDFRKMLEAIDAIVNRYYPEQREESPEAAQAVAQEAVLEEPEYHV